MKVRRNHPAHGTSTMNFALTRLRVNMYLNVGPSLQKPDEA